MRRPIKDRRSVPKELHPAYDAAMAAGWRIDRTGSGHLLWLPPSGPPVLASSTPRSSGRAIENIIGKLRQSGLAC